MTLRSLRSQLLVWLLAPLATVAMLDAWVTYRDAIGTATVVQERMLLGAARMIGEQVRLEEGVVQVVIPPAALELFASPSRDRVFYRISEKDGELLSGYYDLPLPPRHPSAEEAIFFDTTQRDRQVRAVAFAQPVLAAPDLGPILIEVAQTLQGRDALAREIWHTAVRRQAGLLALVSVLLWLGLRRGILPLITLRDRILERKPGTLERQDDSAVPSELQPLVNALNGYVERLNRHMSDQERFIANAAHQLRTPLTLLNTQVIFALRNEDPATRAEALRAIHESTRQGMRLVQQLMSSSMVEAGIRRDPTPSPVDLSEVVRTVLETQAPAALARHIDLGGELPPGRVMVQAVPSLLPEMVSNLVDNAIRYTPPNGVVTARVHLLQEQAVLELEDNGPGIPIAEHENVFERFYRLQNTYSDGCGLGLAIVREIAGSCRARIELSEPATNTGLVVRVVFMTAASAEAPPVATAPH